MEYTRLKTGIFVGIGEANDQDWSRMVATQVTDVPFALSFQASYNKKREPHIGDTEILLYLSRESITPNAAMVQLSYISLDGTHQS